MSTTAIVLFTIQGILIALLLVWNVISYAMTSRAVNNLWDATDELSNGLNELADRQVNSASRLRQFPYRSKEG